MSLEALLAEITRSADDEEARIRQDAGAREAEILRACDDAITSRREAELARLSGAAQQAVSRDTAAAERAGRLAVLEARSRLMTMIFGRAGAELARADGARYREGIQALVNATLPYLEGRTAVLRCRPDVAAAVDASCAGIPAVEVEHSEEFDAGVLGESRDGALLVDNRLAALLERRREDLGIALARRLEDL